MARRLDLHNHTVRHSPCSILEPRALVERAVQLGLEGLVVTEHHRVWDAGVLRLAVDPPPGFVLLRGQEVTTPLGHVLVFGVEESFPEGTPVAVLRQRTDAVGGALVLAHIFRWGQFAELSEDELVGALRPFDAVEVMNGNLTRSVMARALRLGGRLGWVMTGGSDAHALDHVGRFETRFADDVRNEADLVRALRSGRCRPQSGPAAHSRR